MSFDHNRPFIPLRIVVLTISDSRTKANDSSGAYLCKAASDAGHTIQNYSIITDDLQKIVHTLQTSSQQNDVDVILCTGGTGLTGRDVTPEAFSQVVEKWIPGFGELFRYLSFQKIGTSTIQSRATAGIANGSFLFALPGSTGACKDAWEGILKAQLDIRHRPCNFAELIPRLQESPWARKGGISS